MTHRNLTPLAMELCSAALLRGSFTLRSGRVSDRYFDKYRISCDPALLSVTARALAAVIRNFSAPIDCIVAPELGAVPLATAVSLETSLPFVIVRNSSKQYGTGLHLEGTISSGSTGVLLEDVVTSGGAALRALHAARDAGIQITNSLCVLDRDGGGAELLKQEGAPLRSLLDARDLDLAFDAGLGHAS